MTPISSQWPFAQWGIDIMGPFPLGKKQLKFLIVAIDYFTKLVEAELVTMITESKVTSFVWKNIICRFGVPCVIISDNGKQFNNPKFWKFCQDLGVKNHYSSPRHPQANGQTKVMNRSLLKIIKTRLEGAKGPEELQNVLWAYRTTTRVTKSKKKLWSEWLSTRKQWSDTITKRLRWEGSTQETSSLGRCCKQQRTHPKEN